MPWLIDFTDQKVVIIGGGKIAYRKVQNFLKEGARVCVVALEIKEEFYSLNCELICDAYHQKYLDNAFFVFAATNQKHINQQIVDEAKNRHIMCASATKSTAAIKSMATIHTQNMTLGISTNGQYPALSSRLQKDLLVYDEYLHVLSKLRTFILEKNLVDIEQRQNFFHQLFLFDLSQLELLQQFLRDNQGIICIFSHHIDESALEFSKECQCIALAFQDKEYQLKIDTLIKIKIQWIIQPMVISTGVIYQRIQSSLPYPIKPPLFNDHQILNKVYHNQTNNLFIIHPRSNQELYQLLSQYGDVMTFQETPSFTRHYHSVIPFLLQKGHHYYQDITLVIEKLAGRYDYFDSVLLDHKKIRELMIYKIKDQEM